MRAVMSNGKLLRGAYLDANETEMAVILDKTVGVVKTVGKIGAIGLGVLLLGGLCVAALGSSRGDGENAPEPKPDQKPLPLANVANIGIASWRDKLQYKPGQHLAPLGRIDWLEDNNIRCFGVCLNEEITFLNRGRSLGVPIKYVSRIGRDARGTGLFAQSKMERYNGVNIDLIDGSEFVNSVLLEKLTYMTLAGPIHTLVPSNLIGLEPQHEDDLALRLRRALAYARNGQPREFDRLLNEYYGLDEVQKSKKAKGQARANVHPLFRQTVAGETGSLYVHCFDCQGATFDKRHQYTFGAEPKKGVKNRYVLNDVDFQLGVTIGCDPDCLIKLPNQKHLKKGLLFAGSDGRLNLDVPKEQSVISGTFEYSSQETKSQDVSGRLCTLDSSTDTNSYMFMLGKYVLSWEPKVTG